VLMLPPWIVSPGWWAGMAKLLGLAGYERGLPPDLFRCAR